MKILESIDGEVWRNVVGFTGYWVSDLGRCKRVGVKRDYEIEGKVDRLGYRQFGLILRPGVQRWFLAHRLIAATFLSPEIMRDGQFLTVNHKNRIRHDNRVCNLELVTVSQNHQHWRKHPLHQMAVTQ